MVKISIPTSDDARISWAEHIKNTFPDVGANLGFTAQETVAFVADCETVQFAIRHARAAKNFSKAATKYKAAIIDGKLNVSDAPEFAALEKPAVLTASGAFKRVEKAVKRMAAHPNFGVPIGESLRIIAAHSAPLALDEAKPKGSTLTALINSVVRLDWRKGKFHAIGIESQRGEETVWQEIGLDMRSPFIDARPPLAAGKPEERRYRLRYYYNDEAVGDWSDIITIITQP